MAGLLKDCTLKFNPNDENILSRDMEKLLVDEKLRNNL